MMTKLNHLTFQRIDSSVLDKNKLDKFDIYYLSSHLGEKNFVKFSSKHDPAHHEKISKLLEAGELHEDLYIHETDLLNFYEHASINLREFISDPAIPTEKKLKKVYNLAQNLTKSFFEQNANPNILRASDQVVELLHDCLGQKDFGIHGLNTLIGKDYYTYTHSINVGLYCMTFGIKLGMSREDVRELGLGGMLHDVGKAKIPDEIINKSGKLTVDEFEKMKKHTYYGQNLLEEMGCFGENILLMVGQHHESHDGSGYHLKIPGEEISMFAKICKVSDVYDALVSRRTYKKALKPFDAFVLMKTKMGHQFDQKIFSSFVRLMGPSA